MGLKSHFREMNRETFGCLDLPRWRSLPARGLVFEFNASPPLPASPNAKLVTRVAGLAPLFPS